MHVFVLEILLFKNFAHLRLFWNLSTRTTKKQSRKEKKQMAAKCYTTTEKPRRISNVLINYSDNGC